MHAQKPRVLVHKQVTHTAETLVPYPLKQVTTMLVFQLQELCHNFFCYVYCHLFNNYIRYIVYVNFVDLGYLLLIFFKIHVFFHGYFRDRCDWSFYDINFITVFKVMSPGRYFSVFFLAIIIVFFIWKTFNHQSHDFKVDKSV